MIDYQLRELGLDGTVRYQNPSVLYQFRTEISQLQEANRLPGKRKQDVLVAGDCLLTNEHLISAWAHASWRVARIS